MSDTTICEALERARRVFSVKPAAALKPNPSASARLLDGLRVEVAGPGDLRVFADMAPEFGGGGSAPGPGWYLRASLASCAAIRIKMRAAELGIALDRLEVTMHSDLDYRGMLEMDGVSPALSNLRMEVRIAAANTDASALRDLVQWAEARSPVSCTVRTAPQWDLRISTE